MDLSIANKLSFYKSSFTLLRDPNSSRLHQTLRLLCLSSPSPNVLFSSASLGRMTMAISKSTVDTEFNSTLLSVPTRVV